MQTEILWNYDTTRDFLGDLRNFTQSLDFYEINFRLDIPDEKKYVVIKDGNYEVLPEPVVDAFRCPHCQHQNFNVMEGVFQDKPVLGLSCDECDTYGAVFPQGL